jgi:hypothetical protein
MQHNARCCRRSKPLELQPLQGQLTAVQPRHHRGAPAKRQSAPVRRPPRPPQLRILGSSPRKWQKYGVSATAAGQGCCWILVDGS